MCGRGGESRRGAPPQGLCKAPRDSGMCLKRFMICLEEIRFVVVVHLRFFDPTPMHGPGRRRYSRPCYGPACAGAAGVLPWLPSCYTVKIILGILLVTKRRVPVEV